MKTVQQGFTLIELMIVVAIIGILAMFALPVYQDYTKRTHIAEGITLAAEAKSAITEYYAVKGLWPKQAQLDISSSIKGNAVTSVKVSGGGTGGTAESASEITITYNAKVGEGAKIKLIPFVDSKGRPMNEGSIQWICHGLQVVTSARPRPLVNDADISEKWLPPSCYTSKLVAETEMKKL